MAGFELGDVTPYLALGGLGLALFFVLRSVRFVDARIRDTLQSTLDRNAALDRERKEAEAEADHERQLRIVAQEAAALAQAQVMALSQRVEDLTAEVARLKEQVERLRQEMHQ